MNYIKFVKKNFKNWNKKQGIYNNNRQYKLIGCGPTAFKVLKFEPQHELNNKGGWSQVFWNYQDIKSDTVAFEVIKKAYKKMGE